MAFDIQVGSARHRVEWPLDFSEYRVIPSRYPAPLKLCERLRLPEVEVLRSHLLGSDLDVLAYYICNSDRYLQNCQDRMDWFFALDYHVDGPSTPPAQREEVVRDLVTWLSDRSHLSRFPWLNNVNAMYQAILEELERDGLDTSRIIRDAGDYFRGFLLEFDAGLPLEGYLENRSHTIGMREEIEFCFAYLGRPLPREEHGAASQMKDCSAHLVALQNDALSQHKEEKNEEGHLHVKTYFPDSREYVSFLNRAYRDQYEIFLALRPSQPGPLEDLWQTCHQWICGSLVWHLTSRRYDQGQYELRL